jgi:amino acid transporter
VIGLKRNVTLVWLTFYGLGNILGAGIYVLIGKIAGVAGMHAPLAFLVSVGLVLFSALSYAELAARYPMSAGEAVYVQQGFGLAPLSALVGLLIAMMGMVSSAAITRGAVGYVAEFVTLPESLVIVLILSLMGGLAVWGIEASVKAASLFTLVEILGLLLVIWVGREALEELPSRWMELLPANQEGVWAGILLGALLAFYAFIGFEDMVNIAEEVKQPQETMPRAILLALLITVVLYIALALVAVLNVPTQRLSASDAPLALIYREATGHEPFFVAGISLFAVINGVLIQIIMVSRILYGMAKQGWVPGLLARVSARTQTPIVSTLLVTGLVLMFALWLPMVTLAKVTSLIVLLIFSLVNLALWRIKRRIPRVAGVRRYPMMIPVIGFTASASFLGYSLWMLIMA